MLGTLESKQGLYDYESLLKASFLHRHIQRAISTFVFFKVRADGNIWTWPMDWRCPGENELLHHRMHLTKAIRRLVNCSETRSCTSCPSGTHALDSLNHTMTVPSVQHGRLSNAPREPLMQFRSVVTQVGCRPQRTRDSGS